MPSTPASDRTAPSPWPEIDFTKGQIKKAVKGGKVVTIPLTGRLRKALLDFKASRKILSEYVIPSPRNPRKPLSNPRKGFVRALKTAGIKNFRWHDLRHTFATHFLRRTGDLRALQEILGHSSITQTEKYAHVLDEHRREAMEKFERGWISHPIGAL